MKYFLGTLLVGTVLACAGGAPVLAAAAADPIVGAWTLSLTKSKYSPGPAPKSLTRTYAETAQARRLGSMESPAVYDKQ